MGFFLIKVTMKKLPKAKYSPQKTKEKIEINVLENLLLNNGGVLPDFRHGDDDFPNIDGRLEILDENNETTGLVLEVQVKPLMATKRGKLFSVCGINFLSRCLMTNIPNLLIGVDCATETAYWTYISPNHVDSLLSTTRRGQKSKTIYFSPNRKIEKNKTKKYLEEWKEICNFHNNKYNSKLIQRLIFDQQKKITSKNFDEIIELFKILKNLALFKSDTSFPIADFILDLSHNVLNNQCGHQAVYKTPFGDFQGKSIKDLKENYLELLNEIKYLKTKEVFEILVNFYYQEKEIKQKAEKVLIDLVKYNLKVLQQVGYTKQREVLDVIKSWKLKEREKKIDLIKIITKELLKSSFEGTTMTDYRTLSIQFGALIPTRYLRKIREDAIDLIKNLYPQTKNLRDKLELLEVLENALRYPEQGDYSSIKGKIDEMITADAKGLIKFYKNVVFASKKNKIIAELPIIQEIERQLNWLHEPQKSRISEIKKILEKLKKDEIYSLYRLLVGDVYDKGEKEKEKDWKFREKERDTKLNKELERIENKNIKSWIRKLNLIAKYKKVIDDWKLSRFNTFLFKFAQAKPNLAKIVLDDAFQLNKPLKQFTHYFLQGLREIGDTQIYDEYLEKIIKEKNVELLIAVINSLFYINLKTVRKKDIKLLNKIIQRENSFNFLDKIKDKSKLISLNYTLLHVLSKIYEKDKKEIEELIKTIIKNDSNNLHIYLRELNFAGHRKTMDISNWSKSGQDFILSKLVELKNLDYDSQNLLLTLAKKNYKKAMDIFIKRIKKRSEMTKDDWISSNRYDAIPYHFNEDLKDYIRTHKNYIQIAEKWINQMTSNWSIYNSELAHLLQGISGDNFKNLLLKVIKRGGRENLNKVIYLSEGIDAPDFDICFEIIKRTDDEKIWKEVAGRMYATGVVHGEYGLAEAYKKKLDKVRQFDNENNKRIKKFKQKIIKELKDMIKREKQAADKEIKEMKKKFEIENQ